MSKTDIELETVDLIAVPVKDKAEMPLHPYLTYNFELTM